MPRKSHFPIFADRQKDRFWGFSCDLVLIRKASNAALATCRFILTLQLILYPDPPIHPCFLERKKKRNSQKNKDFPLCRALKILGKGEKHKKTRKIAIKNKENVKTRICETSWQMLFLSYISRAQAHLTSVGSRKKRGCHIRHQGPAEIHR